MTPKNPLIILCAALLSYNAVAQNVGDVKTVERITDKNVMFLDGGLTLREAEKEQSNGITIEFGYMRRFNKIFSVGPVISYSNYYFDSYYFGDGVYGDVQEDYFDLTINNDPVLSVWSFGAALRASVPTPRRIPVTLFGYVAPSFVAGKTHDLEGTQNNWTFNAGTQEYDLASVSPWTLEENKSTSIAMHLGGGLEIFPGRKFSVMVLMTRFIAFNLDHIDIAEFHEEHGDDAVLTKNWPYSDYTFKSWNLRFGILYNFE
jgi:hypothetical protein